MVSKLGSWCCDLFNILICIFGVLAVMEMKPLLEIVFCFEKKKRPQEVFLKKLQNLFTAERL
jgi:hypothetical protein